MSLHAFSWVIEGQLAAMARPDGTRQDLEELKARGIGALVNVSYWEWAPHLIAESGLACLHLPVEDFAAPRADQVDAFIEFCDDSIRQGRAVAVHCFAGRGRTGTVVACYLVHRGMGAREAIDRVRRLRPGSIETASQEAAVQEFASRRKAPGEPKSL